MEYSIDGGTTSIAVTSAIAAGGTFDDTGVTSVIVRIAATTTTLASAAIQLN